MKRDWAGNYKECTYHINTGWSGKNPDYPNHKEITTWNNAIRYFVTLDVN